MLRLASTRFYGALGTRPENLGLGAYPVWPVVAVGALALASFISAFFVTGAVLIGFVARFMGRDKEPVRVGSVTIHWWYLMVVMLMVVVYLAWNNDGSAMGAGIAGMCSAGGLAIYAERRWGAFGVLCVALGVAGPVSLLALSNLADSALAEVRAGHAVRDTLLGFASPFQATVGSVESKKGALPVGLADTLRCGLVLGQDGDGGTTVVLAARDGTLRTVTIPSADALVTLYPDAERCPDWPAGRRPRAAAR